MLDDVIVVSPDGLLLTLRLDHPFIPSDRFYSAEFCEGWGFFSLWNSVNLCFIAARMWKKIQSGQTT